MILLDSDHASFLKYPDSERGRRMMNRLISLPESEIIGVTISRHFVVSVVGASVKRNSAQKANRHNNKKRQHLGL